MTKPMRVLIIEDDQNAREEIGRALSVDGEFNFEVTGASTVEEATEILKRERRFDLVLIDWRLDREEGGSEILDMMQEKISPYFPKIKIVYTGYASMAGCVKAMRAGADDYIDKNQPGALEKLLGSAKELLRARRFDEHEPDSRWIAEHLEELMDYHGELIAFIDGEVVDHASTRRELTEKVKKRYPDEEPFIMFAPAEVI